MAQVIPAIIAENFQELEEKIKSVEGLVEWVQIDIMDGKFVVQKTFNRPSELANLKTSLKLEAHLMIEHPWNFVQDWVRAGVKRVLVHYEAVSFRLDAKGVFEDMIATCHEAGCEFGIAINPETPIDFLDEYILKIDAVQVMGVKPGRAGQHFQEHDLSKIQGLREKYPGVKIEVDGGVNDETAPKILRAGADILIVGSYVWKASDNKKAIEDLKNIKV